ncbi:radical SAM family heme chaperone HemW [Altericista sp. CCNU0014]|uniref:radical SAM family heme chaperone HemW n=1 Tax=Altericista sp. CCNU0014 TaxID=3082949 RepID=UPI00384B854D
MALAFSEIDTALSQAETWDQPTAAYVHIPFCRRRCFYCDFPVSVIGDRLRGETSLGIQQYVDWLCQEIRATPSQGQPLQTIFFGGGTPSLLAVEQVHRIVETLGQQFGLAERPEISMEMDPGTFTSDQIQGYRQAGVNRVSLGSQAFQDELLRDCGRTHRTPDIYAAVDLLRQAGYDNLSLDLISGLPNQTLAQWEDSLNAAIALAPQHLSAYDLVLEPGTVFGKRFDPGEGPLPSDNTTAQMYRLASQALQASGYEHYEISNYARPGFECRHNLVYWRNASYYGFGMGAASYVRGQRFSRPRSRESYAQWLVNYIEQGGPIDAPVTSANDRLFETFMVGLRRTQGVALNALAQNFGTAFIEPLLQRLKPYRDNGWVELTPNGDLRLSDPEGFLFSNAILVALWEAIAEE